MSSQKYIDLRTDDNIHFRRLKVLYRQIKELEVTISLDVNVQAIASQHLYRHLIGTTYYAICNPFIFGI